MSPDHLAPKIDGLGDVQPDVGFEAQALLVVKEHKIGHATQWWLRPEVRHGAGAAGMKYKVVGVPVVDVVVAGGVGQENGNTQPPHQIDELSAAFDRYLRPLVVHAEMMEGG